MQTQRAGEPMFLTRLARDTPEKRAYWPKGADVRRSIKAARHPGAIVLVVLLATSAGNAGSSAAQTASPQRRPMPPTERQTTLGLVVGSDLSATSGTYAWKGVPYAKPPVGDL